MAKFNVSEKQKVQKDIPWEQWSVIKQLEKANNYPWRDEVFCIVELLQQNRNCLFKEPFFPREGVHGRVTRVTCTHPTVVQGFEADWQYLGEINTMTKIALEEMAKSGETERKLCHSMFGWFVVKCNKVI